ncbi:MAG: hypothetical protein J5379_00360 [Clostridiales bacterium]|nr:hypothetical protein [Clostridiales bacterium]
MRVSIRKLAVTVLSAVLAVGGYAAIRRVSASSAPASTTIKSITSSRNAHIAEYQTSSLECDKKGQNYYAYYCFRVNWLEDLEWTEIYNNEDIVFTIKYNDGRADLVGTAQQICEKTGIALKFEAKEPQESTHWVAGGSYDINVSYLDGKGTMKIIIDECPISSVTFASTLTIDVTDDCVGMWDKDPNGKMYYRYFFPQKAKLTFTYKDGSKVVATGIDDAFEKTGYGVTYFMDQDGDTHWYPGNTYPARFNVAGKTYNVNINITESPIKRVDLDNPVYSVLQGTCGYMYQYYDYDYDGVEVTEAAECFQYDIASILQGHVGTVYYKTSGKSPESFYFDFQMGTTAFEMLINSGSDQDRNVAWGLGAHKFYVYYQGYEFTVPVNVYKYFDNFSVEPKSGVTMSLSWSKVNGAASYEVYGVTGEWGTTSAVVTVLKTLGKDQTSCSITGLTAGTINSFGLVAKDSQGTEIAYSKTLIPAVALAKPTLKSASVTNKGVSLSWSACTGADGYNIYRSTSQNGTYSFVKSVKDAQSTVDTTVKAGQKYYYKVRAYKKGELSTYYGGYSNVGSVTYQAFTSFDVVPKSGVTMVIGWSSIPGAASYDVMYSTDGTSFKTAKSCGSSQTYTSHTGLTAGKKYSYKVLAKNSAGNTIAVTSVKSAVTLASPAMTATQLRADGSISISWSKASGADRYNVYRSTVSESGPFEYIASVQGKESYVDKNTTPGQKYYYRVCAYKKIDGTTFYGEYSDVGSVTYRVVSNLSVTPKSGVTMSISWGSVSGAYSYDVMFKADGGSFKVAKSTGSSQTSCSHTGLAAGKRYSYMIIARNSSGKIIAISGVKAAVALATPTLNSATSTSSGVKLSWSKASGADRYNVYRSTSKNGTYEYVASVQGTETYTDTSAKSGTTYYYKVRAYKKVDGNTYYGGYSNAVSGKKG